MRQLMKNEMPAAPSGPEVLLPFQRPHADPTKGSTVHPLGKPIPVLTGPPSIPGEKV